MDPKQTKLVVAASAVVIVVGGLAALNHVAKSEKDARLASADGERTGADVRSARLGLGSHGGAGGSDSDDAAAKNSRKKAGGSSGADAGLASIIDAATTTVQPIETEAETRERERYEKAQANKFKYRETDPAKIQPTELTPALEETSKKYGIPDNLMAAMMYVETGGTHRDGDHSMEAGYGVMNLRESNTVDTLGEAASLIGKSKDDVLYNQKLNVEAAGALLRSYYDDAIASGLSESEAWYNAVAQYSGRSDPDLAAALADETAGWLMKGFDTDPGDGGGHIAVPPSSNPVFLPKNWKLVGMTPPGGSSDAPQSNQSGGSAGGSAAGGQSAKQ